MHLILEARSMNRLKYCISVRTQALVLTIVGPTLALGICAYAAETDVSVEDSFFSPSAVTIKTGDSVRWNWIGSLSHTSTSSGGLWNSGLQGNGFHFTNTFHTAGTFPYVCTLHAGIGMTGSVVVQQATSNVPPVVSITQPTNGATFAAPWTGAIHASASDPDGTVAKVEFFSGTTLLGTVLNPASTLSFTVTNLPAGPYSLKAVAVDNLGASNTSAIVSVSVVTPVPILLSSPARISANAFQFDFAANPGLSYAVERSSDLVNWIPLKTNSAAGALVPFLDNAATGHVNFYSVRRLPNP